MRGRRLAGGLRSLGAQVLGVVAVAIALTLTTFVLIRLTPGNSATAIAVRRAGPGATTEQIDRLADQLGLRDPLIVQYGRWLRHAITGDLGVAERSGLPVGSELRTRLPKTLVLAAGGAAIALLTGVAAGVAGAVLRPGLRRGTVRAGALLAASVPAFWLSYLLILVFSEHLRWLPASGDRGWRALLMPWIVLGIPAGAIVSRAVAVSLRGALRQPFVTAARARGASAASVVVRDALPHAAAAAASVAGLQVAGMLAGTVIVETVFGWPGLGRFFVTAVSLRDADSIQAAILVFAVGFMLINRAADTAARRIDPRLRVRDGR